VNGASMPAGGDARAVARPSVRAPRRRWTIGLILAVCIAPVVASYLAYYVFPPGGRTNYGELIEPQRDVSRVELAAVDGGPGALSDLGGKWVLVTLAPGACDDACSARLWTIRQVRLTTGAERDRVERLLLITDSAAPAPSLLAEHDGLRIARIAPAEASRAFPAAGSGGPGDHVWLVDPRGNLMMRFPAHADPARMKKDLVRLLRASRIG
jgi:hypothetical protein